MMEPMDFKDVGDGGIAEAALVAVLIIALAATVVVVAW